MMNRKSLVWVGMVVGSFIGSILPELWGADMLSMSSIIFSTLGAALGIYAGFKIGSN